MCAAASRTTRAILLGWTLVGLMARAGGTVLWRDAPPQVASGPDPSYLPVSVEDYTEDETTCLIMWIMQVPDIQSAVYHLRWGEGGNLTTTTQIHPSIDVPHARCSYNLTNLTKQTTYSFKVCGQKDVGDDPSCTKTFPFTTPATQCEAEKRVDGCPCIGKDQCASACCPGTTGKCQDISSCVPSTAPTTAPPTSSPTSAPTTSAPTTAAPTTAGPTTSTPTSASPTPAPSSAAPTSSAPTTPAGSSGISKLDRYLIILAASLVGLGLLFWMCLRWQRRGGPGSFDEPFDPESMVTKSGTIPQNAIIRSKDLRIYQKIGCGGYGEVHLGEWRSTQVAIKTLVAKPHWEGVGLNAPKYAIESIKREAAIMSSLRHPNIALFMGCLLYTSPSPRDS
eukprot:TRINITY_DN11664_c0_g1_i5.p1 TRINITY_DN11664_c0_g1~~TRINITY_DN11664_c0_g1_i5.p1  ORF type:complete len:394 (-),score=62.15 TRINITY_DN11664_c0_g1_i5:156-1337(-)